MKNKQLITIPLVSLSYDQKRWESGREWEEKIFDNKNYIKILASSCLLYTSDAADE